MTIPFLKKIDWTKTPLKMNIQLKADEWVIKFSSLMIELPALKTRTATIIKISPSSILLSSMSLNFCTQLWNIFNTLYFLFAFFAKIIFTLDYFLPETISFVFWITLKFTYLNFLTLTLNLPTFSLFRHFHIPNFSSLTLLIIVVLSLPPLNPFQLTSPSYSKSIRFTLRVSSEE